MSKQNKPQVGQIVVVYGHKCEIFKVHSAGTIDVVSLDGEHAWRVSGLAFQSPYVGDRMLAADLPGSF